MFVLTFRDSFWPLFLLRIIDIMYVTIARHQFCHNNFNQNCLQDTIDTVAICVPIDKMIKNTSSALLYFGKKTLN